jgi:hypothetical protein
MNVYLVMDLNLGVCSRFLTKDFVALMFWLVVQIFLLLLTSQRVSCVWDC